MLRLVSIGLSLLLLLLPAVARPGQVGPVHNPGEVFSLGPLRYSVGTEIAIQNWTEAGDGCLATQQNLHLLWIEIENTATSNVVLPSFYLVDATGFAVEEMTLPDCFTQGKVAFTQLGRHKGAYEDRIPPGRRVPLRRAGHVFEVPAKSAIGGYVGFDASIRVDCRWLYVSHARCAGDYALAAVPLREECCHISPPHLSLPLNTSQDSQPPCALTYEISDAKWEKSIDPFSAIEAFLMLKVKVTNVSNELQFIPDISLQDETGFRYAHINLASIASDGLKCLEGPPMSPGESAAGWIAFDVSRRHSLLSLRVGKNSLTAPRGIGVFPIYRDGVLLPDVRSRD